MIESLAPTSSAIFCAIAKIILKRSSFFAVLIAIVSKIEPSLSPILITSLMSLGMLLLIGFSNSSAYSPSGAYFPSRPPPLNFNNNNAHNLYNILIESYKFFGDGSIQYCHIGPPSGPVKAERIIAFCVLDAL